MSYHAIHAVQRMHTSCPTLAVACHPASGADAQRGLPCMQAARQKVSARGAQALQQSARRRGRLGARRAAGARGGEARPAAAQGVAWLSAGAEEPLGGSVACALPGTYLRHTYIYRTPRAALTCVSRGCRVTLRVPCCAVPGCVQKVKHEQWHGADRIASRPVLQWDKRPMLGGLGAEEVRGGPDRGSKAACEPIR